MDNSGLRGRGKGGIAPPLESKLPLPQFCPPPLKGVCLSLGLNKYNEKVKYLIHSTIFLKVSCESVFSPPPRRCNTHNKTTSLSFAQYRRGICKRYVAHHIMGCTMEFYGRHIRLYSYIFSLFLWRY